MGVLEGEHVSRALVTNRYDKGNMKMSNLKKVGALKLERRKCGTLYGSWQEGVERKGCKTLNLLWVRKGFLMRQRFIERKRCGHWRKQAAGGIGVQEQTSAINGITI